MNKIIEMYNEGCSMRNIADCLGVDFYTVRRKLEKENINIDKRRQKACGVVIENKLRENECTIFDCYENGINVFEIAKMLKVGATGRDVYSFIKKTLKIDNRYTLTHSYEEYKKQWVNKNWDRLKIEYENGSTIDELYLKYALSDKTISRLLKKEGIKVRDGNFYNDSGVKHKFFSIIDTEEKAYLLGLLLTDGNVSKDNNVIKICVSKADVDILEKVKDVLGVKNSIKQIGKDNTVLLHFSSKQIKKDLGRYGIVPAKTGKCFKPEGIPIELERHFWRGCIDGDGSLGIYLCKQYGTYYPVLDLCGDLKLIESFSEYCKDILECKKRKLRQNCQCSINYALQFSRQQCVKLCRQFYDNCSLFMNRKQKLAQEIVCKFGK